MYHYYSCNGKACIEFNHDKKDIPCYLKISGIVFSAFRIAVMVLLPHSAILIIILLRLHLVDHQKFTDLSVIVFDKLVFENDLTIIKDNRMRIYQSKVTV